MLRKMPGWLRLTLLATLVLTLVMAASAAAVEIRSGDMVNVPSGNINGPLFITGNNITVNADVNGDVFAAGQSISINGRINGDLIAGANSIRVNGVVLGDIRAAANTIEIDGQIEGSLTGVANSIGLGGESRVNRDALLFGNTLDLLGAIQGQALGSANQMNINGPINGEVRIWDVQKLTIGPSAVIGGMVSYGSANQAQIDPAAKTGAVTQLDPPVRPERELPRQDISWITALIFFAGGIILWGTFYLLFPRLYPQLGTTTQHTPLPTLGWGLLALLVAPLAALLLIITVVGIPLALILGLSYILILCLAKIMVSDYISRYMVEKFRWERKGAFILAFLVTFLLLILLSKIPIIGFITTVIIASMALGMVVFWICRWRRITPPVIKSSDALID